MGLFMKVGAHGLDITAFLLVSLCFIMLVFSMLVKCPLSLFPYFGLLGWR